MRVANCLLLFSCGADCGRWYQTLVELSITLQLSSRASYNKMLPYRLQLFPPFWRPVALGGRGVLVIVWGFVLVRVRGKGVTLITVRRVGRVNDTVYIRVLDVELIRIDAYDWSCIVDTCNQYMMNMHSRSPAQCSHGSALTIHDMHAVDLPYILTSDSIYYIKVALIPFGCSSQFWVGKLCQGMQSQSVQNQNSI